MYNKVNIVKKPGQTGSPSPKNEIVLVEAEDITFPNSDLKGVLLAGAPTVNPNVAGARFITLYSTKSKTEASMETEGDEDAMTFASKFMAQVPGNTLELKEFIQNWNGKNIIIFHKACGEDFYEVMGTPCAPLQLKSTKTDNNDGRFWTLNFEPFAKSGFVPKQFNGVLPFTQPFAVTAVDDVEITEANGYQYKLPALAVTDAIEVTACTVPHESTVTLIGSGGAAPATLAQVSTGNIMIFTKNNANWVALEGAIIHFKVFKAGSITILTESSRQ